MATTAETTTTPFEGAMRWVGDLDHPFYDDERQRHVWYEGAMIGFQLLMMLQLVTTAIVMIVVGPGAEAYWLLGIGPVAVAAIVASG